MNLPKTKAGIPSLTTVEEIRLFPRPIPLNDIAKYWTRDYRVNRYLAKMSRTALDKRSSDILSNLLYLGDDGRYRPRYRIRQDGMYAPIRNLDFLRMAVDVWEELRLRGDPVAREPLAEARIQLARNLPNNQWCRRQDWITGSRLSPDQYEKPRMLFRFSKAHWNAELINIGRIRISPASLYDDQTANNAVRDKELLLHWFDRTSELNTAEVEDYYAFCLSSEYDTRLFGDFQADSCVGINDPYQLSLRLRNAVFRHNEQYPANKISALYECPVIYVDPFMLETPTSVSEVYFCKHFRFSYQTEFRFILTQNRRKALQPLFLDLGSLEDIAEMIAA